MQRCIFTCKNRPLQNATVCFYKKNYNFIYMIIVIKIEFLGTINLKLRIIQNKKPLAVWVRGRGRVKIMVRI